MAKRVVRGSVPLIDNRQIPKPLEVVLGQPTSITVQVSGVPPPTVKWQIGRKRVKESVKYQLKTEGKFSHTLLIAKVAEDLDQGIWVVATNDEGEDCCRIDVQTRASGAFVENKKRRNVTHQTSDSAAETKRNARVLRKKKKVPTATLR